MHALNVFPGDMKKSYINSSHCISGVFPSPGTPNYLDTAWYQKGCSSERVPLPVNCIRRNTGGGSLLLFNNGRALPSKWEDAERWIFSPVSADGGGRYLVPGAYHRRPKSKSGPLGPLKCSPVSPIDSCFDSEKVGSFKAKTPFVAGALVRDCGFGDSRRDVGGGVESVRYTLANVETDEKFDCIMEGSRTSFPAVLKRDVATQMSPERSTQSSLKHLPSYMPSPRSVNPIDKLGGHFPKLEVRDVQVEDQVAVARWPKKQIVQASDKHSTNITERKRKSMEAKASVRELSETVICSSKTKREKAKITAWEDLQKAKAEVEKRKLEMKLEKERSSSMKKILKKLRLAQKKAEMMLSAETFSEAHQFDRTAKKDPKLEKKHKISFFNGCFTCHAC